MDLVHLLVRRGGQDGWAVQVEVGSDNGSGSCGGSSSGGGSSVGDGMGKVESEVRVG
jgi:hypothetical protein